MPTIFDPIGFVITITTLFVFVLNIWDEVRAETSTNDHRHGSDAPPDAQPAIHQ